MFDKFSVVTLPLIGLMTVGLAGCAQSASSGDQPVKPEVTTHNEAHNHGDHNHNAQDGKSEMEKMKEGLAGLSEEDRASAMKQHFCLVSGEMLGSMGAPIKVSVKEQDVWICCNGCKKPLESDPDKYLAKLNN